jgi:hypothetical protein
VHTGGSIYDGLYPQSNANEVRLNGVPYLHAISGGAACDTANSWAEYDLSRDWSRFSTTVGIEDGSSASSAVTFNVRLDGELAASSDVALGHPVPVDLDVTDVLRLRLEIVDQRCGRPDQNGTQTKVVFADPKLEAAGAVVPLSFTSGTGHLPGAGPSHLGSPLANGQAGQVDIPALWVMNENSTSPLSRCQRRRARATSLSPSPDGAGSLVVGHPHRASTRTCPGSAVDVSLVGIPAVSGTIAPTDGTGGRRHLVYEGIAAFGGSAGLFLVVIDPGLAAIIRYIVASLGLVLLRALAKPRRLQAWIEDLADVLPSITKLLDTFRHERIRWRRPTE